MQSIPEHQELYVYRHQRVLVDHTRRDGAIGGAVLAVEPKFLLLGDVVYYTCHFSFYTTEPSAVSLRDIRKREDIARREAVLRIPRNQLRHVAALDEVISNFERRTNHLIPED